MAKTKQQTKQQTKPLEWEAAIIEHPTHGKLNAEKAKSEAGTFVLYQEPDVRRGVLRLDWTPVKVTVRNPPRSSRAPGSALKRLAQKVAAANGKSAAA